MTAKGLVLRVVTLLCGDKRRVGAKSIAIAMDGLREAQVQAFATKPAPGETQFRVQNVTPNIGRIRYPKRTFSSSVRRLGAIRGLTTVIGCAANRLPSYMEWVNTISAQRD